MELEAQHGVDLDFAYWAKNSAKSFVRYIAQSQRQDFFHSLSHKHFFSMLMDGTTDVSNTERELIVVLYQEKDDVFQEMKSVTRYFSVVPPERANAGLVRCLGNAMKQLDTDNILNKSSVLGVQEKPIIVGVGTKWHDGNPIACTSVAFWGMVFCTLS